MGFLYAWDNWISKSVGCSNLLALLFGPAFSDQAVVKFCQVLPIKLLPSFVNWQQCFSFNQLAAIVHQLKKSSAATLADAEVAIISVADAIILVSEYPMLSFLVFFKLQSSRHETWSNRLLGLDGPDQRPLPVHGRRHETRRNQFSGGNDKGDS